MGLPYVLSSDLVSAYPAKSLEIAQYVDGQLPLLAMTQNAQTGASYSFLLTDFTKLVTLSNAGAVTVTLPLESSVAWPANTQLRLLNLGAGTVTVVGAGGVTINGSPLTLAQFKAATLVKNGTNTWTFLPFSSGVGAANFSDAATGTYSGFKYLTFTASGTMTVTTAGFADIVIAGGGGGGGNGGGGGAGGVLTLTNVYLPVGTLTCTIGAGGSSQQGNASRVDSIYGIGGGWASGSPTTNQGQLGGSGAGGTWGAGSPAPGGTGTPGQGNDGGAGSTGTGNGGGGGATAVGGTATGNNGANGGAGTTTSIAGTTPSGAYVAGSYALGGGGGGGGTGTQGTGGSGGGGNAGSGGTATSGTANTGGGGGGAYSGAVGNGGSGIIIVRVAV
jgi:hypothetical protein